MRVLIQQRRRQADDFRLTAVIGSIHQPDGTIILIALIWLEQRRDRFDQFGRHPLGARRLQPFRQFLRRGAAHRAGRRARGPGGQGLRLNTVRGQRLGPGRQGGVGPDRGRFLRLDGGCCPAHASGGAGQGKRQQRQRTPNRRRILLAPFPTQLGRCKRQQQHDRQGV